MNTTLFEKYICMAFTYSGIRKLFYTYDSVYKTKINNQIEERPILYCHRIIHFLFAGIMGIGLAPKHLVNDIERMEMSIRNIKPFPAWHKQNDTDFYTVLLDFHVVE